MVKRKLLLRLRYVDQGFYDTNFNGSEGRIRTADPRLGSCALTN